MGISLSQIAIGLLPKLAAAVEATMGVFWTVRNSAAFWTANILPAAHQGHEFGPASTILTKVEFGTVGRDPALCRELVVVVGLVGCWFECCLVSGRLVMVRMGSAGHWLGCGCPVVMRSACRSSLDGDPILASAVDAHKLVVATVRTINGLATGLKVTNTLLLPVLLSFGQPVPASPRWLASEVCTHQTFLTTIRRCFAALVISLDAILLFDQPRHADTVVLTGEVGASELLVAAI